VNLSVALGIDLLLGTERERHEGHGPARGAAGARTFAPWPRGAGWVVT
jgi:hypothetical protein